MSQRDNCTLKILLVEEIMLARRNLAKINGGNSFNEGSKMGKWREDQKRPLYVCTYILYCLCSSQVCSTSQNKQLFTNTPIIFVTNRWLYK